MGCCSSKKVFVASGKDGQSKSDLEKMFQLGFSKRNVDVLYTAFCKLDVTGDNQIEFAELCAALRLEVNEFSKEVFAECDFSHNGHVSFVEFVIAMWHFLGRDRESLAAFAFEVFDRDDTGYLGGEEVETMVDMVYGLNTKVGWKNQDSRVKHKADEHVKTVMKKMDVKKDGRISKQEFIHTCHSLPMLLAPAFDVQSALMELCGGTKFWEHFQEKRHEMLQRKEVKAMFKRQYYSSKNKDKKATGEHKKHGMTRRN
jgi:Ca2+-binding EF-hand superfamily protein